MGLRIVVCWLLWWSLSACSPEPPVQGAASPAVGAWSAADAYSPEVQEAARFAVQTHAVQQRVRVLFKDVTQARQQSLSGTHFELQLQLTREGSPRHAQALVWRQADGTYHLQSWDWLD